VAVATCNNLRVWISTDHGRTWSNDLPLDTSSYGYPGSWILDDDESILLPYCASGRARTESTSSDSGSTRHVPESSCYPSRAASDSRLTCVIPGHFSVRIRTGQPLEYRLQESYRTG